jgi:hypothetical protein
MQQLQEFALQMSLLEATVQPRKLNLLLRHQKCVDIKPIALTMFAFFLTAYQTEILEFPL